MIGEVVEAHVAGGIAVEEVTRNAWTGEWDPDLHLIIDANVSQAAVLQGELAAVWKAVTGDSHIIDPAALHSAPILT